MLDQSLIEQLKPHFQDLSAAIDFKIKRSQHAKQSELSSMLTAIAALSPQLTISEAEEFSEVPAFSIYRNGEPTGIHFRGIPGGHEFSSLVLAILNAAGKGKLPDQQVLNRIRALKGPAHIRTYVSLSCENCPDVVQALNQIAIYHPQLQHEMIDGGLVPEEVKRLGISGVPTVVHENEMIHFGRASLGQLLDKLEDRFGRDSEITQSDESLTRHFQVVVVGGGPAGVSAAVYSARKGLTTAVVTESIGGQVQETKGIENLIATVYTEGPQLSAKLDEHLRHYEVEVLEHRRVKSVEPGRPHKLLLNTGEQVLADSLIIATGAKWRELNVPGEKNYIGRGVAYCPHCDGPYYKGKDVAVVGGGNSGVEAAIDLAGTCKSVTVVEFLEDLKADRILIDKLKSMDNVRILTGVKTTEILGNEERVTGLRYQDRKTAQEVSIDLDGVFVQIGLTPNSQFAQGVLETNRFGEIVIDEKNRSSIPGIYAAGDVTTTPYKQIVISMGEGAKAALAAFEDSMRQ